MDDHPVHTTPNHHPSKMDVFSKTFLHIILASIWFVRYLRSPPTNSDDLCLLFCLILILCLDSSPSVSWIGIFQILSFRFGLPWTTWKCTTGIQRKKETKDRESERIIKNDNEAKKFNLKNKQIHLYLIKKFFRI